MPKKSKNNRESCTMYTYMHADNIKEELDYKSGSSI